MGTLNRPAASGVLCCNVLFVMLLCAPALALQPCISVPGQQAAAVLSDCSWTGAGSGAVAVVGALGGTLLGPPAVIKALAGARSAQGPGSAQLVHVILDGFTLPDPSSGQGLVPTGLLGTAKGQHSLSLQDVRILVDQPTLQQHVGFFAKLTNVTTYTDGQSFLHVNYYSTGSVSWKSVGLLLATSLEDARRTSQSRQLPPGFGNQTRSRFASLQGSNRRTSSSALDSANSSRNTRGRMLLAAPTPRAGAGAEGLQEGGPRYNYVLAANRESLVGHIQRLGAVAGPTGCLIYLQDNVTLSKPPVPAAGIPVARPLAIVGLSRWVTSIDFYMQVNQLLLNYTWSNITFDSVVTENLGVGDAKSAELARPLSVSSANNFWPLFYNRSEDRLLMKNVTSIFGSQEDLDYYMFWATVYHSNLPYFKAQAAFIHNTILISVWKVGWQTETSIQVIKCVSAACRVIDCQFQLDPVVAPRMPLPRLSPELQLRPAEKSSLVTAIGDAEAFQEHLQPLSGSEAGRAHVLLLRSNISLQPLFSAPHSANDRVSANSSSAAAAAAGAYVPPGIPLAGIPVSAPLSIVGDLSNTLDDVSDADTVLDLAFARGLLDLSGQGGGRKSQLQVQHLRLRGLAQGPGAAGASSLRSPDSWTLLGWAFRRSAADDIVLSGCTLELPPPEFDRLAQLSQTGSGQVVLKLSGDVRTSPGDGLVVLTGVMLHVPQSRGRRLLSLLSSSSSRRQLLAQDSQALWVESLSAQGLSGTKLVLVPSESAADAPWGYHWPGGAAPVAAGGMSRSALAAAIAVPVVVGAALAAAAAFVVLSRRKKHRLQLEKTASATGLVRPLGSGSSAGCSSGPAYDSKCAGYAAPSSQCCSIDEMHPRNSGSGNAAVDVSPLRCSMDAAAGEDQVSMRVLTPGGSKGAPNAGAGSSAGSSSQGATGATGDSAQSLDRMGRAKQEQPPGLSHRLTSAISRLQHDITRRRIGGPLGSSQQQTAGEKRGSSGGRIVSSGGERAASEGGSGRTGSDGDQQPELPNGAPSERPACSLATPRSPAMAESAAAIVGGAAAAELQIMTLIGRGSFASVYRAIWRGRCVALKVVQLPAMAGEGVNDDLSNALQTRERMAVMEAVVSVTMSHPNIVQVYTFALQPLFQGSADETQQEAGSPSSSSSQQPAGWELQLIMEYCEEGSLRGALNQQRLVDPAAPYRLPAVHLVLALAHDVACAMLHLHSEQIVHSDLKASNVLLTKANTFAPFTAALGDSCYDASSGSAAKPGPDSCAALLAMAQTLAGGRLVAKVADFGLSFALDPESTHISHMHAGTLTHMAPELLLHGRASKASDVYAFGILLWELVTGLRAFQGMPVALVGHNVTQLGLRPPWIPGVSPAVKQLIEDCWAQDPDDRPPFSHVLLRLEQMLQQSPEELCPPAPPSAAISSTGQQQQQQQQQRSPADEHLMQQWRQLQKERQLQRQQAAAAASSPGGMAAAAAGAAAAPAAAPVCAAPEVAAAAAAPELQAVGQAAAPADVTGDWTM